MAEASAPEKLTHHTSPDLKEKDASSDAQQALQRDDRIQETPRPELEDEEEEEEETCGFCKFMKGGGCKSQFVSWMECVDGEKAKGNDFVETCMTQIRDLRECMLANPEYYRPMLEEEEHYLDEKDSQQETKRPIVEDDPKAETEAEDEDETEAETEAEAEDEAEEDEERQAA